MMYSYSTSAKFPTQKIYWSSATPASIRPWLRWSPHATPRPGQRCVRSPWPTQPRQLHHSCCLACKNYSICSARQCQGTICPATSWKVLCELFQSFWSISAPSLSCSSNVLWLTWRIRPVARVGSIRASSWKRSLSASSTLMTRTKKRLFCSLSRR